MSTSPDLTDPVVVHANMLRGTIAKPNWEQIKHLYPEQFVTAAQGAPEARVPLADHDEISRKVLAQPWAIQSAIVTIAAHCTVIKDKCEDGDLPAILDLAGCISQDLLELANFYAAQPPASPISEGSR